MTTTATADPGRLLRPVFWAVLAPLFAVSLVGTVLWCASMSAMPAMPMPGGWAMSMAWMRMPGQTWTGAAASFLGMWILMMVAMMLPSLVPVLRRSAAGRQAALVGAGYFLVWSALGLALFPLGVGLAAAEMRQPALARAVPLAAGLIVVLAGWLQLTGWKARQLAGCRAAHDCGGPPRQGWGAWRYGVRLGLRCVACCAGLTAILLVMGVMDLRAMALVTAAITLERLVPGGRRVARASGAVAIAIGLAMLVRAAGLG